MKLYSLIFIVLFSSANAFAGPGSTGGGTSHFEFALNCQGVDANHDVSGSAFLEGDGHLTSAALGQISVSATAGYDADGVLNLITLQGNSDSNLAVTLALQVPAGFSQGVQEFDNVADVTVTDQPSTQLLCHFSKSSSTLANGPMNPAPSNDAPGSVNPGGPMIPSGAHSGNVNPGGPMRPSPNRR